MCCIPAVTRESHFAGVSREDHPSKLQNPARKFTVLYTVYYVRVVGCFSGAETSKHTPEVDEISAIFTELRTYPGITFGGRQLSEDGGVRPALGDELKRRGVMTSPARLLISCCCCCCCCCTGEVCGAVKVWSASRPQLRYCPAARHVTSTVNLIRTLS